MCCFWVTVKPYKAVNAIVVCDRLNAIVFCPVGLYVASLLLYKMHF